MTPVTLAPRTVVDGGLGSYLEALGHDLSGRLWSARILRDHPEAVVDVHRDYFAAGASIAITSSYQLSFEGLASAGIDSREGFALLERSVALAAQARDELRSDGLVAASVGPYGAALADGSEYRGDYDLDRAGLRAWHAARLEALLAAGPDLLAIETIPSRDEAGALIDLLRGTGASAWLSFTTDGGRLRTGESLEDAFRDAEASDEIVAVGVNCCHPDEVDLALAAARRSTGKAVVVYPNSGETWNAVTRRWEGTAALPDGLVERWLASGATAIGGCCRVGPEEIRGIAAVVEG
ncbi:MAG: homocysteine S-methyltransferase [Yonghaparkia sp.]|nr:homocysteine S-methyltransferase [Microcella sp.]